MSIFGNREPEPEVDGNGMPVGDSNRHAPLRDEDELAAQFAQAMRAKQQATAPTAPPGAKPEEGDMSGTFPFDEHLDEASKAALWMISDGKLTQIAQELSDFFGTNVNWRDVKKLAGLARSARSSSKVQRKLVWDAVEELILLAMQQAEDEQSQGKGDEAASEPTGEPAAADPEPDPQSPPEPEEAQAQAQTEPDAGGNTDNPPPTDTGGGENNQADPPSGDPNPEGETVNNDDVKMLGDLLKFLKPRYADYQGLRQLDDREFMRQQDEKQRLYFDCKDAFDAVVRLCRAEAQRVDPQGDRLKWRDDKAWEKWVWRKLQSFLHPDGNGELTREDFEALFAPNGKAKASAGTKSAGSSQQKTSQSSSRQSGSSRQRSQSSSSSKPASFDRMVKMARQFIEAAPIERWTYTRTDHNNQYLNAGFIRLVARYGLTPFKEAFAADLKDLSPAERNELASKVFKAAFAQILTDTFG